MVLEDTVEMDGMYVGGTPRPANRREDRVDHREVANPKRQCVMALRQRQGRTLATVVPGAQREPAWDLVRRHVRGPARLVADEAPGYDDLVALFPMTRNNHGRAYVVEPDSSTNQAESLFSRMRRSFHGVHHRAAGTYLDWYVADLAHREDMRRVPMKELAGRYLGAALAHSPAVTSRAPGRVTSRPGPSDGPRHFQAATQSQSRPAVLVLPVPVLGHGMRTTLTHRARAVARWPMPCERPSGGSRREATPSGRPPARGVRPRVRRAGGCPCQGGP